MLIDQTKILSSEEVAKVLISLRAKIAKRGSLGHLTNLIVFRLATGCGLRASEIALLNIGDVHVDQTKPHIELRSVTTKRKRPRKVPLWWDAGTYDDLRLWKRYRMREMNAKPDDPFVCQPIDQDNGGFATRRKGERFSRLSVWRRFRTACHALGKERQSQVYPHMGRHTFASHMLAAGRTIAEVQSALGHSKIDSTAIYLHVAVDDDGEPQEVFREGPPKPKLTREDLSILKRAAEIVKGMEKC